MEPYSRTNGHQFTPYMPDFLAIGFRQGVKVGTNEEQFDELQSV